jgi:iron complex outermembrane recepter protein
MYTNSIARRLYVTKVACKAIPVLSLIFMILPIPADARAQQAGQLAGSIHDQTGGALAGVTITVRGAAIREGQSDVAGRFDFRDLPPGDYDLNAVLKGFESARRRIQIQPGETLSVSFTMFVAVFEQTVVTAAKGGERDIQSIPLAISAVSAADLTRLDIRTVDQATALMPSVTFTQNGTFGQLSIRGIGTNAVNAGADPSSAMYLDGVYLARPAMVFADFLDLDRIEVLRGPQGTLYGRNAVGGALNLISKSPTNDVQVSARVTAGNLGELRAQGRVSGALKRDRVMGSVAVVRGVRDGYVRDLNHPDHPLGGDDLTAARGQLRVILDRRSDVLVSTDVTNQDGTLLTFNKVLRVKPGVTVDNPTDLREVRTSTVASSGLRQSGITARLTSALTPSVTVVSLTAFRKLDNEFLVDADITELDLLSTHNHERQHQFSQEVTASQRKPGLEWVAGLFFFDEIDHQTLWVDQPQARTQIQLDPRVDASSIAIFGEATLGLTSRLSGKVGLRYTREGKDIDNAGGRYNLDPPMAALPGSAYAYADSIEHTAWTPKFGVEMKLPSNAQAYVSATRGFKSGGFNLSSTQPGRGYAPEWAWSYEGGLKTELMSGRARIDVAAFHMDYTNLQVQTPIGIGVFDIRNAAAATIRGVEVEAKGRIARGIESGGHLGWLDATYDRYIAVALGGVTGDVAGKRLNNAPEWSGRLWMEWTGNIGHAKRLTLTTDAMGQSTVFYTPFNDDIQRQRPYGTLAARAEYGRSDRRWAVNVYARNLTNTGYIMATFGTAPTAFGGRPGASRQFGVQLVVQR